MMSTALDFSSDTGTNEPAASGLSSSDGEVEVEGADEEHEPSTGEGQGEKHEEAALLGLAIANYERYHSMPAGAATAAQVEASSAGFVGGGGKTAEARASAGRLGRSSPVRFA